MADKGMKKRWISLYVENQVGVLSKISGLFSGKAYKPGQPHRWYYRGSYRFPNDHRNCKRR